MELSGELQQFFVLILNAVIAAAVPALVVAVRVFVNAKVAEFRARLTAEQLAQLDFWAEVVVKSLEQSALKEGIERTGEEKLQVAITTLQEHANKLGLTEVSVQDLADLIRAKLREGVHKDFSDL